MRILSPDRLSPQKSPPLPCDDRLGLDLGEEVRHPLADLRAGQMPPAGEWLESQGLRGSELQPRRALAAITRGVLTSAIEPVTSERRSVEQSVDPVHAGPILRPGDQSFLAAMREQVLEAPHLGRLLVAHHDGLIAASPELVAPMRQTAGLSGQVGIDETHETREPLCVRNVEQEVEMIREEDEPADLDRIEPLGSSQDADHDLAELGARP